MKKTAIAVIVFTMLLSIAVFAKSDAIDKSCGDVSAGCHNPDGADRVYNAPKRTTQRWDSTVSRMQRHGLKLNADQEKAVKDYLYTLVP